MLSIRLRTEIRADVFEQTDIKKVKQQENLHRE